MFTARADIAGVTLTKLSLVGSAKPSGITAGPDGNAWYIDEPNKSVGKLVISGSTATITQYPITLPAGQTAVNFARAIVGGADAVWFVLNTGSAADLGRITPDGTMTVVPISGFSSAANSMVVGPDGNIWYTEFLGRGVMRVTPQGAGTRYALGSDSNAINLAIVVGADQALWVSQSGGKIYRITTAGAITQVPTGGTAGPMTLGADGNIWFAASASKIGRLKPDGRVTLYTLPDAQASPGGLVSGPDGNIWFTEHYDPKVGRIVVSSAKDDGTAQIDVQSFGYTSGKGGQIIVLPPKPASSGVRTSDASSDFAEIIANFMDSTSGGDVIAASVGPAKAKLVITKRHSLSDQGRKVLYSIVVRNAGTGTAEPPFFISDALPARVSYSGVGAPIGTGFDEVTKKMTFTGLRALMPGAEVAIRPLCNVKAQPGDLVSNFADVTYNASIGDNVTAVSDTDTFIAGTAELSVTKEAVRNPDTDAISWRVTVTNNGSIPADPPIKVTDTPTNGRMLPFSGGTDPDITCSTPTDSLTAECVINTPIAAGQSRVLPYFVTTPSAPEYPVSNVASVKGGNFGSASSQPATASPRFVNPLSLLDLIQTIGR